MRISVEETEQDKTGRRGEDIVHTIMHGAPGMGRNK